jgi:hypothetical protein
MRPLEDILETGLSWKCQTCLVRCEMVENEEWPSHCGTLMKMNPWYRFKNEPEEEQSIMRPPSPLTYTPTPWKYSGNIVCDPEGFTIAKTVSVRNAAHIVHCVNRFEALTDQLEAQSIDYQDNLTEIQLLKAKVEAMDVDRMERAAIQVESLNGECNRLKAQLEEAQLAAGRYRLAMDQAHQQAMLARHFLSSEPSPGP